MPDISTYSLTGNSFINSLLGPVRWATSSLTYSFPATSTSYGTAYGSGESAKGFGSFNAAQQSIVRSALNLYSSVANLTFSEVTGVDAQHADLRFAQSDVPGTAWAYFPTTDDSGGDVWFNNSSRSYDKPAQGNYASLTFIHEIGHALGLEHAHEGTVMPLARDAMEYTVMSYRSYAGASTEVSYANETWGYAQSLMMYDIAALQHMYGANYASNGGNTTYAWSPNTGEMFVNGAGQGAPGGNRIFQTVWDGGGTDTYDFSNYGTNLKIDLRPGEWSTASASQLAKLHWDGSKLAAGNIANALLHNNNARSLIENATGGWASDVIKGNSAGNMLQGRAGNDKLYGLSRNDILIGGSGKDLLSGGSGNDTASYVTAKAGVRADLASPKKNKADAAGDRYASIENLLGSKYADDLRGNSAGNSLTGGGGSDKLYGRGGRDTLTGGSGADTFIFKSAKESRGSATDTIKDFRRGSDHIDLRGIDADTTMGGNQAFSFIGKAGFSGKAGQLRFTKGVLSGDVNGDGVADFQIKVQKLSALSKGDLYL